MNLEIDLKPVGPKPWAETMGIDPTKPSRAVVAQSADGHGGVVLWYVGADISYEIDEVGLYTLEELGLDDAPVGISIWEGSTFTSVRTPSKSMLNHMAGLVESLPVELEERNSPLKSGDWFSKEEGK